MSDARRRGAAKYRERDALIMKKLQSSDASVRDDGWHDVEKTYRKPLAQLLRRKALCSTSAAFETILDQNLQVDSNVFADIWQDTRTCLCENVEKENFRFKGNLLAYLCTIAKRLIRASWKKERKHEQDTGTFPGDLGCAPKRIDGEHDTSALLKDIKLFYDRLNKKDKMAFRIGMRIATADRSRPMRMKVFVEKVRRSGAWDGSDTAIARRYARLRENLRDFLWRRGHNRSRGHNG